MIPVKGMTCATCAMSISKTLHGRPGVRTADVNFGTEKAVVEYDPEEVSLEEIGDAIRELEYEPVLPSEAEGSREVTLVIVGMTCTACVAAVERALKRVPGVLDAVVNLATEKAFVRYDPEG